MLYSVKQSGDILVNIEWVRIWNEAVFDLRVGIKSRKYGSVIAGSPVLCSCNFMIDDLHRALHSTCVIMQRVRRANDRLRQESY
jgi:hypothetical protein